MNFPPLSINLTYPDKNVMEIHMSLLKELGVKRLVASIAVLEAVGNDKDFANFLVKASDRYGMSFFDAHAPCSLTTSLGTPLDIELSTQTQLKTLQAASEIGVKVLTMHTCRTRLVKQFAPESGPIEDINLSGAIDRTLKQLDILLPVAEKLGITIALENLFLPSTTATHLMKILQKAKHPNLGLCYDSGHALIIENQPNKKSESIAEWIACGWPNETVTFQADQLDIMLNEVVTTHFHDNNGTNDQHLLPGDGIANWEAITNRIKNAPRLLSVQCEVLQTPLMDNFSKSINSFAKVGFNL